MDRSEPMTYQDAAAFLGITYGALRAAVSRGELTPFRPFRSKLKMLRRADVERYKRGERLDTPTTTRPPEPQAQPLPVSPDMASIWPMLLAVSAAIGERFAAIASSVAGTVASEYRGALVAMFQAATPQQTELERLAGQMAREASGLGAQVASQGITDDTLAGITGIVARAMQQTGPFTDNDKWALDQLQGINKAYAQRAGAYTVPGEAPQREKVPA